MRSTSFHFTDDEDVQRGLSDLAKVTSLESIRVCFKTRGFDSYSSSFGYVFTYNNM